MSANVIELLQKDNEKFNEIVENMNIEAAKTGELDVMPVLNFFKTLPYLTSTKSGRYTEDKIIINIVRQELEAISEIKRVRIEQILDKCDPDKLLAFFAENKILNVNSKKLEKRQIENEKLAKFVQDNDIEGIKQLEEEKHDKLKKKMNAAELRYRKENEQQNFTLIDIAKSEESLLDSDDNDDEDDVVELDEGEGTRILGVSSEIMEESGEKKKAANKASEKKQLASKMLESSKFDVQYLYETGVAEEMLKLIQQQEAEIDEKYESDPDRNKDYMNACTQRNQHQIMLEQQGPQKIDFEEGNQNKGLFN